MVVALTSVVDDQREIMGILGRLIFYKNQHKNLRYGWVVSGHESLTMWFEWSLVHHGLLPGGVNAPNEA